MISKEQMERAEGEFEVSAAHAFEQARGAERALESYTYSSHRTYDPQKRAELLRAYQDADFLAESRAWILGLIRLELKHTYPIEEAVHTPGPSWRGNEIREAQEGAKPC